MPAPSLSIPVRANLDQFNKGMSDMGNVAGRATRLVIKQFEGMNSAMVAGSAVSFRGLALGIGGAVVAAKLLGSAISATREQLAEMVDLSDKARDRGIGGNFFQRFTAEAHKLKVEAKDLEGALSHAFSATQEKSPINLSEWETGKEKITEVEKALRVYSTTGTKLQGLVLFRDAQDQEQKIEAILTAMTELDKTGRKLESLQLGELMFGKSFADNIRLGKTSAESILQSMKDAAEAGAGMFSDKMIERAKEVDDKLKLAHQRLERELKPSWESLADTMLTIKEAWAFVVDKAASFVQWVNRIELTGLKNELNELNAALEAGANRSWPYSGTPIEDITARRDQVQGLIDDRSGPSRRPRVTVTSRGTGAAPTKKAETESRDRFDSAIDNVEKRTASLQAETSAIDLGTAARERAKIVAELETVAKQANTAAGKENADVTEEQRQKIEAVADAWGRAQAAIEAARSPLATFARESRNVNLQFQNFAVQSLGSMENEFVSLVRGTKDLKTSFKDLIDSMIADLARLAFRQAITAPIANALNGMFGGGVPGSAVAGFSGSAVGPGGINTLPYGGPRAAGGPVSPNTAYVVGERRAELFIPKVPGTILPHVPAGSSISSNTTTINAPVTVNVSGQGGKPEDNEDLAKKIGEQVRNQMREVAAKEIRTQMRPGGMLK